MLRKSRNISYTTEWDYDPVTGIGERYVVDGEDVFIERQTADLSPIMDQCHEKRESNNNKHSDFMWHTASIPIQVYNKICMEHGADVLSSNITEEQIMKSLKRDYPKFLTKKKSRGYK